MPTEPIKPAKRESAERHRVERESVLPSLERLKNDRMMRNGEARVRAAVRYEGPTKDVEYTE